MKQSLVKYLEYLDSDEEFTYILRMEYEWHQDKFEKMISHIRNILQDFKDDELIPKCIIYFFINNVDFIIGTTSKNVFFNNIPNGYTKEQYSKIIKQGQDELLNLRKKFYAGDYN